MSKITELQEKRARIWKQAKDFLDTKQKESDVLSAEDNTRYEKMEQEVVDLGKEIDRRHKQAEIEVALNNPPVRPLLIPQPLISYQRVRMLMQKIFGK